MILFKSEYYFNQRYFQFRVEKIFPRTSPEKFPLWEEVKAWWHGIKTVHARFPTRQFRVPRKNIEYTFQARNHPSPTTATPFSNSGGGGVNRGIIIRASCLVHTVYTLLDVYTGASELICFIFNPLNIYLTRAPLIFLHC